MCFFCLFSPDGFHGDVYLTIKMLLPGVIKIVYNLNDKQIVKLFSRIFNCNQEEMVRDLEQVSADSSSLNFCSPLCLCKFYNGLGFLLLSLTVRMRTGDLFWFSLALAVFIAFSAIWNL